VNIDLLFLLYSVQERMHVVWQELVNSGRLTPSDFVRVTSTTAAQVFNIYPRKVRCCVPFLRSCMIHDCWHGLREWANQ
jgi:hypothetical protein